MVTYSRLPRGQHGPAARPEAGRQEPYLEAREVPYRDDDLRAYDPDRAPDTLAGAVDELAEPRRKRRGGFGAVVVGTLALAAGMVILAYAYGVATRVDEPSALTGQPASATRGTLPADDAARSIPVKGEPASAAVAPTAAPAGSAGIPMDGDTGQLSGGAQPALIAPVPATTTPAAPNTVAPAKETAAKPADAKPADTKKADAKPTGGSDDLMANIEKLLQRDAASAGAAAPSGGTAAAAPAAQPIEPATQPAATNALPQLPAPNTVANTPAPQSNRLVPPADIPNVPASDASTGDTGTGLGTLH